METGYNKICIPRVIGRHNGEATVTGEIDSPAGRNILRVLSSTGKAEVSTVTAHDGYVTACGRIMLDIICEDVTLEMFSYSASASFEKDIPCEGVTVDNSAFVTCQILSLEVNCDAGVCSVTAEVDFFCRTEDTSPTRCANSHSAAYNIELMQKSQKYRTKNEIATAEITLREEIVANDIADIVYVCGEAYVRDVRVAYDYVRVDGVLCISALCVGSSGVLFSITQNIPFTQDIDAQESTENTTDLSATVCVRSLRAYVPGEELGLIAVESELSITLFKYNDCESCLTLDAYSPMVDLVCHTEKAQFISAIGCTQQRETFRETIEMPENAQGIVFTCVRPTVTSAALGDDGIYIDGLVHVTLICTDNENKLFSHSTELPYSHCIGMAEKNMEIDAFASLLSASATAASGHADITYTLLFSADIFELCEEEYVAEFESRGECKRNTGIFVCFAGEGERIFDLGKRFLISTDDLKRTNPDLPDTLHEGDYAVVLL